MAYVRELDQLRPEVKVGVAGNITYTVTVDGVASTPSAAVYTVYTPTGAIVQDTTSATINAEILTLDIPAIPDLHEAARVDIDYTVSGVDYWDTLVFDVVRTPWRHSGLPSLSDLREVRPDILRTLDRVGVLHGYTTGDEAQTHAAAIYSVRARVTLDGWLRASATAAGKVRPSLIVDRRSLHRVEIALAISHVYASLTTRPTDTADEYGSLAMWYEERARAEYDRLTLQYDTNEDGVADITATPGALRTIRVQS